MRGSGPPKLWLSGAEARAVGLLMGKRVPGPPGSRKPCLRAGSRPFFPR